METVWVLAINTSSIIFGVFLTEEAGWDYAEELCLKSHFQIYDFTMTETSLFRQCLPGRSLKK